MCCFSRAVGHVSNTRIYAAASPDADGMQRIVYDATVAVDEDLAMVLPVPVPAGTTESAVGFVDLSDVPTFFDALEGLFPTEMTGVLMSRSVGAPQGRPRLEVHTVGAFDASFVPTVDDFDRLDPRFAMPRAVWDAIPEYAAYGFVVFKLRPTPRSAVQRALSAFGFRGKGTPTRLHPMAFDFPRADPSRLFFPTLHVHDGAVHAEASFDHTLYTQLPGVERRPGWTVSKGTTDTLHGDVRLFVLPGRVHRRTLVGTLPNRDQFV